jgi:dolichol kinase
MDTTYSIERFWAPFLGNFVSLSSILITYTQINLTVLIVQVLEITFEEENLQDNLVHKKYKH